MILWGNDTVIALTKPQLIKINRSLNDYTHIRLINKTLQKDLAASDSIISYLEQAVAKFDTIYTLEEKKSKELADANVILHKAIVNEQRKNKICIGVGGIMLGVMLIFLVNN